MSINGNQSFQFGTLKRKKERLINDLLFYIGGGDIYVVRESKSRLVFPFKLNCKTI